MESISDTFVNTELEKLGLIVTSKWIEPGSNYDEGYGPLPNEYLKRRKIIRNVMSLLPNDIWLWFTEWNIFSEHIGGTIIEALANTQIPGFRLSADSCHIRLEPSEWELSETFVSAASFFDCDVWGVDSMGSTLFHTGHHDDFTLYVRKSVTSVSTINEFLADLAT